MFYDSHLVAPSTCLIHICVRPQQTRNSFSSCSFQLQLVCANYAASSPQSERLLADT